MLSFIAIPGSIAGNGTASEVIGLDRHRRGLRGGLAARRASRAGGRSGSIEH